MNLQRLLAVSVLCAGAMFAQASNKWMEEVKAGEMAWASAAQKNDLAGLAKLFADEMIYSHSSGLVETKAQYLEALKSGNQKYTSITHSDVTMKNFGDTALVVAKVNMKGTTKGVPFDNTLRLMHTWVKRDGRWQLAGHQTAKLP